MAVTDNMEMDLPTPEITLWPEWAAMIVAALQVVDAHDHSEGEGVLVTPAGFLVNDDFDFQEENLVDAGSLGLADKAASDVSLLGTIQRIQGNLWWINQAGAAVQLTSGSSIVSAGSGVLTPSVISSYPYSILTSDAQAVLIIDSASARTLLLPAASNAMTVYIKDGSSLAQTNNITVTPDGTDLIDGVNANYLIDQNNGCIGLISDGVSKWYLI